MYAANTIAITDRTNTKTSYIILPVKIAIQNLICFAITRGVNIIEQTNKGRTITKIFMRKMKNPLTVPYQHSLLLKSLLRARILCHYLCSHKCLSSSHLGSTRKKKKRWRHIPANEVFILQGSWAVSYTHLTLPTNREV